ncbi:MAG: hypothetical protein QNK05_14345 [Myxococcota bacterium]|nr:hypothetical protein [Myxococcota bacterium]
MTGFRILLSVLLAVVVVYTGIVIVNHGMGLIPIFFGAMAEMTWQGQFNLDFMGFLVLSATWLAWRNHFSPAGLALGVGGLFLGIPFLTTYLLIVSRGTDSFAELFLGKERARAIA